ncbi:hypothetical protein CRYUN_Cryun16bG0100700 [Craigia yunnanensis]
MTEVLQSSPSHFSSPSSSTSTTHALINSSVSTVESIIAQEGDQEEESREEEERKEKDREGDQLSLLTLLVAAFRKSLIACSISESKELCSMEIGLPTNVRHVAHVTFDRFHGFLGLPVEFEPEVPRRAPSASANVFGVSTESMQLSFDSRGNSVPTILLLMQRHLYAQGGLQAEGIFRINAENSQEEYVREQLNRGVIPDGIDVHCLAGLIKAWFRELPSGVLDSIPPEQVIQSQSEEECARLVRLLPPTEAALLDWAINLMADVVQLEHLNKMNARNIAMVFAPNMTQMSDPLTALMYAVQVMNFLKTLIIRTLKEREDSMIDSTPVSRLEPSDKNGQQSSSQLHKDVDEDVKNQSEGERVFIAQEPAIESPTHSAEENLTTESSSQSFLTSIENICAGSRSLANNCPCTVVSRVNSLANRLQEGGLRSTSGKSRTGQSNCSGLKKGSKKANELSMGCAAGPLEKSKGARIIGRINLRAELFEAWRETHLWYIIPDEVKSVTLLNQYSELLSSSERENVNRMGGDQLKKRALLARALVRTTIARYRTNCQMNPRSLKFRKNVYGKPEVEWQNEDNFCPPPLHFNISHTSSMIACGVTVNVPIGIDVEEKQRRIKNNIVAFTRRYFSPYEVKLLTAISDPEVQRQEFIKLWTLKEAYVKALGKGFSAVPFKTFTIRFRATAIRNFHPLGNSVSEASEVIVESSDDPTNLTNNWQFALLEVAGSHYATICMEKDKTVGGEAHMPMKLTVRKTIPFVEDVCVSGTGAVLVLGGIIEQ